MDKKAATKVYRCHWVDCGNGPSLLSEHPGGESNPGRGYAVDPGLYRGHILRQQKQQLHSGAMKGEHYDDSGVGFLWDSCSLYSFV